MRLRPVLALLVTAVVVAATAFAADAPPDPLAGLEYRLIGPAAGGRVARVCGVAGDPLTFWAATAAGGVWKSVDGGGTWSSVFDDQPVSSIGSIAVAPSDPNVVWVGSGEANIRGNAAEGNGVYRSTDGGKTWSHVWIAEGQIGSMAVHPTNPDIAWAAALGSPFGPTMERGVYRTVDGGATWRRTLFVDENTGASDVWVNPANPRILFAGTWQVRRTPWSLTSGGPGGGLWTSTDGGDTWTRLEGHGLPAGIWGKVGVRGAPGDPDRVYALIEAEEGGLFRSDDGGATWERVNDSRGLRQRAWYYTTLTVDPADGNTVWFPQVGMLRSIDGGKTVLSAEGGGWDYHDIWIDPVDPRRMIVGSDAGVSLTRDGGETWTRPPIPISQFYHATVDSRRPYRVLGSLQDWGTMSGPSNSLHGGGILFSDWHGVGGGEAGHVVADRDDPDIVYAGEYLGIITRWDDRLRTASYIGIYPWNGSGHGAIDLRYRFQWTAPIVASPHDSKVVYHAANELFRTDDGGQSWRAISPDLTRNDPSKQRWSGGPITGDNTGVEFYCTIFAVAESPVTAGTIWTGSDDGLVHVTRDGGATWTDVTPKDMPAWGTVTTIEASRWDAGTAYVVADAHRLDDETPYLWKTADYGKSWKRLTRGLDPEIYLHVVREDARVRGMLYLGTERGVMVSRDDGASWQSLRLNLPTVAVVDLAVADDDLVVATLGRSAWILDDLTPVRAMTPDVAAADAWLFPPRETTAWRYGAAPAGSRDGAAANPVAGAVATWKLEEDLGDNEELTLDVLDAAGTRVRHLSSKAREPYVAPEHPDASPNEKVEGELSGKAGIHRAGWDLRYDPPKRVPGALLDSGEPGPGPIVPPGRYTMRLTVRGKVLEWTVTVVEDPRLATPAADREAQIAFALRLRDMMTAITDDVLAARSVRDQILARNAVLGEDPKMTDLVAQGAALVERLNALEGELHNPKAEVSYDVLAGRGGGAQLHSRVGWLYGMATENEGPPTQGMTEVADELVRELGEREAELDTLFDVDLAALNALAAGRGVPYVVR